MTTQAYGKEQAQGYELQAEHALPPTEISVWLKDIAALPLRSGGKVLDFGAGTGSLLSVLKGRGIDVLGFEPSTDMMEQGLRFHADLRQDDFLTAHTLDEVATSSFDLIISRQVLCHLDNPGATFAEFCRTLRPGGYVFLVDGYWRSFSPQQRTIYPLAGLLDTRPVTEHLDQAGFTVLRGETYHALNEARRLVYPNSISRYLVVAERV